jgi:hypothetical protein
MYMAYNWPELIRLGLKLPNGSDSPVESVNPFDGIWSSITFKYHDERTADLAQMDYRLNREEALRSFTSWGAYAQFSEDLKGTLEPGKLADFVILDRDIMQCPVEDIKSTQVLETVLGGKTVYELAVSEEPRVWIWNLGVAKTGGFLNAQAKPHTTNGKIYIPLVELAEAIGAQVLQVQNTQATLLYKNRKGSVQVFEENFIELDDFCNALELHGNYYKSSNTACIMF